MDADDDEEEEEEEEEEEVDDDVADPVEGSRSSTIFSTTRTRTIRKFRIGARPLHIK